MDTRNRELSQFGNFVNVDNTTKKISVGTTFTQIEADNLKVTGITTVNYISGTGAFFTGIVTASQFDVLNVQAGTARTAIDVIGGIGSITSLTVGPGITTVGFITATNAYISLGATIGRVKISSGIVTAESGIVTYYGKFVGDGLELSEVKSNISISTNTTNSNQLITYSTGFGTVTGLGATNTFTFNPSTGNLGIGTTTPSSKLHVIGDARVSGVVTATTFVGNLTGTATTATTAGTATTATNVIGGIASVTSLNVSGVSTLGTVQVSSGVVTATSGIITYYGKFIGDGSSLSNAATNLSISTNTSNSNQLIPYSTGFGTVTGLGATNTFTFNPSSGNLGIGTTNPTSKLHVVGDGRFTGVVTATVFHGSASGLTDFPSIVADSIAISTNTTNSNQYITYATGFGTVTGLGATAAFRFNPSTGNVGIGTTNPQVKLQVGGVIGFNDTNVKIGNVSTGQSITTGVSNFFAGSNAGSATTSGSHNNFIGFEAGSSNTIGCGNNFFGNRAGKSNTLGIHNTFIGDYAGRYNTLGYHNLFIGNLSGRFNTCGIHNIFLGNQAGTANTTGSYNIFMGSDSGYCNQTGTGNVFIGRSAGCFNTTGNYNTIIGNESGDQTTGTENSFFGHASGPSVSTGIRNSFFGASSGSSNNVGRYNSFFGRSSGSANISGCYNSFFGYYSGVSNTIGSYNIALGSRVGRVGVGTTASRKIIIGTGVDAIGHFDAPDPAKSVQLAIGHRLVQYSYGEANYWIVGNENYNVGIGTTNPKVKLQVGGVLGFNDTNIRIGVNSDANGVGISTGTNNFYAGTNAGCSNVNGKGNVFIGLGAGSSIVGQVNSDPLIDLYKGSNNVIIGECAGFYVVDGCDNNFMGRCAGRGTLNGVGAGQTWGSRNNFFGLIAGYCNTTGGCNNFFGTLAGAGNTSGSFNNFFGSFAGRYNSTGISNNFFGASAGRYNTTGNFNNFFGSFYGFEGCYGLLGTQNTSGSYNNMFGACAGIRNTSGSNNNYFGTRTAIFTTTGNDNVFMGTCAGYGNTSGSCNIYVGAQAGFGTTTLGTGSHNIFIGYRAGYGVTTGTNVIAIGQSAGNDAVLNIGTSSTISNAIILGNFSHTAAFIKISWTVTSDQRDKGNIVSLPLGLDFVSQLNPVQYNWKDRTSDEITEALPRYGFLAQDIQQIEGAPRVIVDDSDPEHLKLRESMLIPVLVNAIKELQAEVQELKRIVGVGS